MMIHLALCFLFFSSGLVAASPQTPHADTTLTDAEREELIALEQNSNLSEALRFLEKTNKAGADTAHVEKLKALAKDFPIIDQDIEEQRFKEAEEILKKDTDKLDAAADPGLVAAARSKAVQLHAASMKVIQAQAEALNKRAQELEEKGQFAEAVKLYDEVLKLTPAQLETSLSPSMRTDVQARKWHAEQEKTKSEASFWTGFWKNISAGLTTVVTWAICFLVVFALFWVWGWVKRQLPAEKGARIAMNDLTGQASEREAKSQSLTGEMSVRLAAIGSSAGQPTDLDDTPDLDSGNFPNIVVHHDTGGIQLPLATTAATVGPFSINPAQLLALWQQLTTRRAEYQFKGSLASQGSSQIMVVECESAKRDLGTKRWQTSSAPDNTNAREEVLATMVEKIAFEFLPTRSTNSFPSFHAYRAGRALMVSAPRGEDRAATLGKAAARFRDSIQADPGNWMGWFYLATVLRKCGENRQAAEHFKRLEELLEQPAELLKRYLASTQNFPAVIAYNRAVCLSKLDDWEMHRQAVELLEQSIKKVGETPKPQAGPAASGKSAQSAVPATGEAAGSAGYGKRGLQMLFRSALTFALTFEVDRRRRPAETDAEKEKKHQDSVLERIKTECQKITELGKNAAEADLRAYTIARAVMKNAHGWALHCVGRSVEADEELREAISLMPDFVDAYVNLAEVLLDQKGNLDPNWVEEAKVNLDEALARSPSSQRAHYLMGRLLMNPALQDFTQAKEHLSKAELIPNSYLFHAQILMDQEHTAGPAIETLNKSIARFPRADHRYGILVNWVLKFVGSSQAAPGSAELAAVKTLLDRALAVAHKLQKQGLDEKRRAEGDRLVDKVIALQEKLFPKSTGPAEAVPGDPPVA